MSTKLKVAFLVTSLNPGGIEYYLLRFITHYQGEIDATVYCKSGKAGILHEKYETIGAKIVPFKLSFFNFIAYYKFYKELKRNNYDSICDFTGNFATLPLFSARFAGIKKRLVFYRGSSNHFKEDGLRLLYNNLMNYLIPHVSTYILANSKASLNFFFKNKWKDNSKYEVIYNGINASQFLSEDENLRNELKIPVDAFVTGHVGRFNEAKNHKTIIEVAVELCKKDSKNYFLFCGKGTDVFLRERVEQEGLDDQIKLLGLRKDVIKVLNTLNFFYFPSLSEGQPNALIEALIAGLPFVASNIEPHLETIPKSHHKQLIGPLDVQSALKKIIKTKENNTFSKSLTLKEWAIEKYNPEFLFKLFFEKL